MRKSLVLLLLLALACRAPPLRPRPAPVEGTDYVVIDDGQPYAPLDGRDRGGRGVRLLVPALRGVPAGAGRRGSARCPADVRFTYVPAVFTRRRQLRARLFRRRAFRRARHAPTMRCSARSTTRALLPLNASVAELAGYYGQQGLDAGKVAGLHAQSGGRREARARAPVRAAQRRRGHAVAGHQRPLSHHRPHSRRRTAHRQPADRTIARARALPPPIPIRSRTDEAHRPDVAVVARVAAAGRLQPPRVRAPGRCDMRRPRPPPTPRPVPRPKRLRPLPIPARCPPAMRPPRTRPRRIRRLTPRWMPSRRPPRARRWSPAPITSVIQGGQPYAPLNGKIEVVEVFNFICPACARFEPLLSRVEAQAAGRRAPDLRARGFQRAVASLRAGVPRRRCDGPGREVA